MSRNRQFSVISSHRESEAKVNGQMSDLHVHPRPTRVAPEAESRHVQPRPTASKIPWTYKHPRERPRRRKIPGVYPASKTSRVDPHPSGVIQITLTSLLSTFRHPPDYLGHVGHNVIESKKQAVQAVCCGIRCPGDLGHSWTRLDVYKGGAA